MTERTTVFGVIFACLASAAAAQDSGGYTLRAFGGLSDLQGTDVSLRGITSSISFSSSTIAGGAVGYDYPDSPWRSEIEFVYRSSEASGKLSGDYASTSIMLNGRYSFPVSGPVRPYVGAGIGFITEIDFDVTSQPNAGQYNDRGGLAGQIMLGADWPLNETWTLFGEARYFTTADTPTLTNNAGNTLKASYRSTDIVAGVIFNF
ncbi:MAG: porin family protein [Rhodobacter sp.]|nr:porin family protein [Rhodobacter sp.]